jgi:2-polyprenyl-3-methyl-5-hydroxy-6-metoxy-1,4-benzoquinol methylase
MAPDSINYYNTNSTLFADSTLKADMTELEDKFISLMPKGGRILDFGCGAGRDAKYFLQKGFVVKALDGSSAMCRIAKSETGLVAECVTFQEFVPETGGFDGVWASASLLHLTIEELPSIIKKLEKSLKDGGILYCSFKYGENDRECDERYFTDMTEERFNNLLDSFENRFKIAEQLVTFDVRPGRSNEKWLNVFLQKR